MKTKHYILMILAGLAAFIAGLFIGRTHMKKAPGFVDEPTVETTVDTIPYRAPSPRSEMVAGTHLYTLPIYRFIGGGFGGEPRQRGDNDTIINRDSAIVELPILQRHYADSTYEAWVSGPVDPQLDSVRIFAATTVITKREWKPPKHWHIGVTAGYGYGAKGFQPYIGVGITYSLISF